MRTEQLACTALLLIGTSVAYANAEAQPQAQPQAEPHQAQPQQAQPQAQTQPSTPMERVENVELFFDTDSAQLSDAATAELQDLATWAKCDRNNAIILEGYADPRGTKDHNLKL